MTKRNERVPPPPPADGWTLRFADTFVSTGWEALCAQFPGPTRRAFEQLERDPLEHSSRQHQLRGSQATTTVRAELLPQWQYEVLGAARVLYAIDREKRTVWLTGASVGHPKKTERGVRRRR